MSSFYYRFRYAMRCAGCPAPSDLFSTAGTATATISAMRTAFVRLGASATAAELLTAAGATLAGDIAVALSAIAATYYVAVAVGALIYATATIGDRHPNSFFDRNPYEIFLSLSDPAVFQRETTRRGLQIPPDLARELSPNSGQMAIARRSQANSNSAVAG